MNKQRLPEEISSLIRPLLKEGIDALNAERGFLALIDAIGNIIYFEVAGDLDSQNYYSAELESPRRNIKTAMDLNKPIITNDLSTYNWIGDFESKKRLAMMIVPINISDFVNGIIYIDRDYEKGEFNTNDIHDFQVLSYHRIDEIKSIIENYNTFTRLSYLENIQGIFTDLVSTLEIEEVLLLFMRKVKEAIKCRIASILTIEKNDEIAVQFSLGDQDKIIQKPIRFPFENAIAQIVNRNKELVLINDVIKGSKIYHLDLIERGEETKNILSIPLKVRQNLIGIVELINKENGFSQSDINFLKSISNVSAIAIQNAKLYKESYEKGKIDKELQLAKIFQEGLLPKEFPLTKGWKIASCWIPSYELSGDFYDYFQISDSKIAILIADVTDHGIVASLPMVYTRNLIRLNSMHGYSPSEIINLTNNYILKDSEKTPPISIFYCEINIDTGELTYVNAGHTPPYHFVSSQNKNKKLSRTGMILGVELDSKYNEKREIIKPNDLLVFYTDGIIEAENEKNDQFGKIRLEKIIINNSKLDVDEITKKIIDSVKTHVVGRKIEDDITLLILKKE